MLSPNQVQYIANLARIQLTVEETDTFAAQLGQILDYFKKLEEVNTSKVKITAQVTGLENVLRKDVVEGCDEETRNNLIHSFPDKEGDLLRVPGVFKE